MQVPTLLSPVYPKFHLRLFQYSLRVYLDTAWKAHKYGVFSGPYFSAFGINTERYSSYWELNKERFLLNLLNGAHCCLWFSKTLSCISLEQEVHWTIRSLFVFDILTITGPLVPTTKSSWRGFTYIMDDFDNFFISGMVYHFGPTIIVESGRIPERHLINWNAPLWDYNFKKGFSETSLMHLWLPFFLLSNVFSSNHSFGINQPVWYKSTILLV